nr:MYB transcription factor protein [Rosa persica]
MSYGPAENSHVANYRMTMLTKFPDRKNWSEVEKENLQKGIRQQFQEMVLQYHGGNSNVDDIDHILASIKDVEITSHSIREFLPKVNWQRLASMYVPGHSGEECEARWLNWEDPLINHEPWTVDEDKRILKLVQKQGVNDWIDIAPVSLVLKGINRTPFQCLARYQRSLNAFILKGDWSKEEDVKLSSSVEVLVRVIDSLWLLFWKEELVRNALIDGRKQFIQPGQKKRILQQKLLTFPRETGNVKRGSQSGKKNNLSSNCQVTEKIRRQRHKNYDQICSDEAEICNGDDASDWDDTIACFAHKVKKRKLQVADLSVQARLLPS